MRMTKLRAGLVTAVAGLGLAAAQPTVGAVLTFSKIADTATAVAGVGLGNFSSFNSSIIRNGRVGFVAEDANGDEGVYVSTAGTISEIAFTGQAAPSLPGYTFTGFDDEFQFEGSTVAFEGFIDNGTDSDEVVVTATGGVLTNRGDSVNTLSPSNGEVFDFVDEPGLFSGGVVYHAGDASASPIEGVYTNASGTLTTVVDETDAVPGLAAFSFTNFDSEVDFSGKISIQADVDDGSTTGDVLLLATPTGVLTNIADTINTISPSTGALFNSLDEFAVDGDLFAFGGDSDDGTELVEGIYTNIEGGLDIVADENTLVPGQIGLTFIGFDEDEVSLDGTSVVFEATFDTGVGTETGIYLWTPDELIRVVDTTQFLDGKELTGLNANWASAISGDEIVFRADFADNSSGVFVARIAGEPIPVPPTAALLGFGLLALFRRRRAEGA